MAPDGIAGAIKCIKEQAMIIGLPENQRCRQAREGQTGRKGTTGGAKEASNMPPLAGFPSEMQGFQGSNFS
jgi:hypothetical protein